MKFKLKENPEQIELLKAVGSKNLSVSMQAQETLAAFLGPVVQKVLLRAGIVSTIYTDSPYDEDDSPSYPLDTLYNEGAGYIQTWSQSVAGGFPTSEVTGVSEMKIATYPLNSGFSFNKRYARRSRLDVISKFIERMLNGVLIKQERNGWAVILKALAEAKTKCSLGATTKHVIATGSANTLTLADFSKLITRAKRINEAYDGGTPVAPYSKGITDLYFAPEVMEQIRAFAWNAVGNSNTDLPANVREQLFRSAGTKELWGINLVEMVEFGDGKMYNTLFNQFTSGQSVPGTNGGAWDGSADQILVGIDNSRGAFVRPIARYEDFGGTFQMLPDEQFNNARIDKAGFWGGLVEGRVALDGRAVGGLVL